MSPIDVVDLASRLVKIESVALIPRVSSTNEVARRVVQECVENEIPCPSAVIVAREQLAGKGRNGRVWHSPRNKGIYATTIHSCTHDELPLLPLAVGNAIAGFLHDTFGIDARLKWPNDVLVDGRKIAGILMEARGREEETAVLIGTGINVSALDGTTAPENVISIAEASRYDVVDLDHVTVAFVEAFDAALGRPLHREEILDEWRRLTVHRSGDPIQCTVGERTISGTWGGIDDLGRALIHEGAETHPISAGDLIMMA